MPLQTITNDIGYSYRVAVTKFGVFGIKVWLYKV
jgi:ribosomal protein S3